MKFDFEKVSSPLTKMADKLNNIKILQAIKNAFIRVIPFSLVASFANLIVSLIGSLGTYFDIKNDFLDLLIKGFTYVSTATIGIVTLLVVLFVSYQFSLELKKDELHKSLNPILATATGLACYFVIVPNTVDYVELGETSGFNLEFFNYNGMFTGVIISILGVALFAKFSKSKLNIKMPASVPGNIFEAFFSLIPLAEVTTVFAALRVIIELLGFSSINAMITQIVVEPLLGITNGLPAIIIVILIQQFLWFLGMHGFNVVWGVIGSIWLQQHFENITKFAETQNFADVEIIPYMFTNLYAMIGGSGSTFGLILAALIICNKKTKEYEVAKLSLVPGIFFINEPIIFGMPIVFNPFFFVPWMLVPIINATIAFIATSTGLVVPLVMMNPGSSVPLVMNYWIMGNFHLSPAILCVLLIILDALLYAPFLKMHMAHEASLVKEKAVEESPITAID